MRLGIVVQCRFNSKRYKGKILKKINHLTILEILIERLRFSKLADDICLAIADTEDDLKIVNLAKKLNINYFVGSEKNVLSRHYHAAKKMNYDHIMRVTSDCPLIDPSLLDILIKNFKKHKNIDYLSNALLRSFPLGMEAEIFTFNSLALSFFNANDDYDKEHVTTYIKNSKKLIKKNYLSKDNLSKYRFTLDTKEDFNLISNIFSTLYPINKNFGLNDIILLMKQNKNLYNINNKISQIS